MAAVSIIKIFWYKVAKFAEMSDIENKIDVQCTQDTGLILIGYNIFHCTFPKQ